MYFAHYFLIFTIAFQNKSRQIKITLPNNKTLSGIAFQTTPLEIARQISPSLAKNAVVAKITNNFGHFSWDLTRPLENDCSIKIMTFADPEGKCTVWHSSAHVLGYALENLYGAYLTTGPSAEPGFFYDSFIGSKTIGQNDFKEIEEQISKILAEKNEFIRSEISTKNAMEIFKYNPYKIRYLESINSEKVSIYKLGNFIDLCTGPHIPNTSLINSYKITKASSTQFNPAKSHSECLQRVYGISFPSKKEMKEFEKVLEEAEKRDHRNIGKQQSLFFFDEVSPGSCFFFPDGAKIYNKLIEFMRTELKYRNYQEVISPNMFNVNLWKTSGHYENFKEDMFSLQIEKQEFALKPMNCPGHCLIFKQKLRSYKELPLRFCEFAVLHRNEYSGALSGLSRVRRFVQDDAHIFLRNDQIEDEVVKCLDLAEYVYKKVFEMPVEYILSTRPKKYIGKLEEWNNAEKILQKVLEKRKLIWRLCPEDGAFYGPKIDMKIRDAQGRGHQTGTIQLDFQLPQRFNLQYRTETGFDKPIIIHRAILGSIERFLGIYLENCAGKFPFWLSPRQVRIIPVSEQNLLYSQKLEATLKIQGFEVDLDHSNLTLSKKIRNAQIEGYNFVAVIGDKEMKEKSVNVRTRGGDKKEEMPIGKFINFLKVLQDPPISNAKKEFLDNSLKI